MSVNEPLEGGVYSSSIIQSDVVWNDTAIRCGYSIDGYDMVIFSCQRRFVFDVPYSYGNVSVTFYEYGAGDVLISNETTIFSVDKNIHSSAGLIVFALILLPILLAFCMFFVCYFLHDSHSPLKLFLMGVGFTFLLQAYNYATISIRDYLHNDWLLNITSTGIFNLSWLFYIVIVYFLVLLIKDIFDYMSSLRTKRGR